MKKITVLSLSLLMMLAACKKDNSTVTAPTPSGPSNPTSPSTFGSLKEAFESVRPKSKTVSFDAKKGTTFYSDNGVRFIFYPHAFRTMDNKPVSGTVSIEVRDCIKESDMILNRMLSMSNGMPLISAGSAYIRATQDGKDIKLGPFMPFELRFPTHKV